MTQKDLRNVQKSLLAVINKSTEPFSTGDLVKQYQQKHKAVPEGYVWDAVRILLDSSRVKLRKDLKIESSS